MRKAAISLAISMAFVGSAGAQSVATPIPQARPAQPPTATAAKPAPRGLAKISNSPLPSYDSGTYQRVQSAMLSYSALQVRGGWPSLPANLRVEIGARAPEVVLRRRLVLSDDLAPDKIDGEIYDQDVVDAVRRFQGRHGLEETGTIGPKTLAALNVPLERRIRQLAASLDRLAELNFNFGQRYVVVNIPAAVAEAIDNDKVQHRYVVVVGKIDRPSPMVTTAITAINLNPTWTVPLSILKKDIVTKMRKDPNYVARMKMRVLAADGTEIDAKAVDWHSDRTPNFTVRQDAGTGNALGALRIDMPNPHAVYMHDTNHKEHFSADYRFQSSGCTWVAEVRDLATWLLQDNPGWGRKELDAQIAKAQSQTVRLTHKVPVAWVYMTGWVTADEVIHFRDDIYNYDAEHGRVPITMQARPPIVTAARASGFVLQSADSKPVIKQVSYLDER